MELTTQQAEQWSAIVLAEYPNEAVAAILEDGTIIQLDNISPSPTEAFKVDSKQWIKTASNAIALLHSHTYSLNDTGRRYEIDPRTPSAADMNTQRDMNIPWGIVATEGTEVSQPVWLGLEERPPLIGRQFIHGITDCYSIVRDYYKFEYNIDLMDYPREFDWWCEGRGYIQDLYEKNFANEGFYEIEREQLQPGDAILYCIRSDTSNHAAVYVGNNEVIHHLAGRMSGKETLDRWRKFETKYLRREKQ